MKRLLLAAALLAAASLGAGCVSPEKYSEAVGLNKRLANDLQAAEARNRDLQKEHDDAVALVAQREAELAAKREEIETLTAARDELNASFDELAAKYAALLADFDKLKAPGSALPAGVDTALRALAEANPDLVAYLPKYGMLKLKADLTFDKGKADVKPSAVTALGKLAEIVNAPEARRFHVYVAGHTDDIPLKRRETIEKFGTNWGLSVARAVAVVAVLTKAGVSQPRMAAVGFGEFHPVAPNAPGKKGNPLNRRVELWIVPPNRFLTDVEGAAGDEMPPKENLK
jgi:chemotaxis protein MotB